MLTVMSTGREVDFRPGDGTLDAHGNCCLLHPVFPNGPARIPFVAKESLDFCDAVLGREESVKNITQMMKNRADVKRKKHSLPFPEEPLKD